MRRNKNTSGTNPLGKQILKPTIYLLIITLLFTYGLPWGLSGQVGIASSTISLAFEGIGKGLDPRGNPFNINEMKSDVVLEVALVKAGLQDQISIEDFRKQISISPNVQSKALGDLMAIPSLSGKTETVSQKIRHPGGFTVQVKDLGIPSIMETKKLQEALLQAYLQYLENKYLLIADTGSIYNKEELDDLDYPEMVSLLGQEADALIQYASGFAINAPDFVSKTGRSFSDYCKQAESIKNTDVRNLEAVVNYYPLTKDVNSRLKYENTLLKRANLAMTKSLGIEYIIADIIEIYDNNNNYLFNNETTPQNIVSENNEYYNSLTQWFVNSKNNSITTRYRAAEIGRNVNKLSNGFQLTAEQYEKWVSDTLAGIQVIYDLMDKTREQIRSLAKENYETNIGNQISVSATKYRVNHIGNFFINLLIFVILYGLYLFIKSNRPKMKDHELYQKLSQFLSKTK